MKARLSDSVIAVGVHSNGTSEQAGIITRVWEGGELAQGPAKVSAMLFPDARPPLPFPNISLYESLDAANKAKAKVPFCYLRN